MASLILSETKIPRPIVGCVDPPDKSSDSGGGFELVASASRIDIKRVGSMVSCWFGEPIVGVLFIVEEVTSGSRVPAAVADVAGCCLGVESFDHSFALRSDTSCVSVLILLRTCCQSSIEEGVVSDC
jgi:hypothetical protein